MPENEVDLFDGFKRSTRPATVSEKPMPSASSGGGLDIVEDLERERLLLRNQRSRRIQCAADPRFSTFPHCLAATSHVKHKVFIIISSPRSPLTVTSQNLLLVTQDLPRESLQSVSRLLTHTPLTSSPTGSGGGPWSADRNPAVLHKPLFRPSDRLDQHVSLKR
jgi:hypothetical protein